MGAEFFFLKPLYATSRCWLINSNKHTNLAKMFTWLTMRGSSSSGNQACCFVEMWGEGLCGGDGGLGGEEGEQETLLEKKAIRRWRGKRKKIYFGWFQTSLSQQCQETRAVCLPLLLRVSTHRHGHTPTRTATHTDTHASVCESLCDSRISLHPTGCNPLKTFSKRFN